MVKYSETQIDRIFHALADQTRREILVKLASGEHTVQELAQPFKMSLPAVSKHLKVLEEAGFLKRNIQGRIHRCNMDPQPLEQVSQTIQRYEKFWKQQLDALEQFLKESSEKK